MAYKELRNRKINVSCSDTHYEKFEYLLKFYKIKKKSHLIQRLIEERYEKIKKSVKDVDK